MRCTARLRAQAGMGGAHLQHNPGGGRVEGGVERVRSSLAIRHPARLLPASENHLSQPFLVAPETPDEQRELGGGGGGEKVRENAAAARVGSGR